MDVEHFDVAGDVVLGAEIQHFLGFGDATDQRTGQYATTQYQFGGVDGWIDRFDQSHQNVHAVETQGIEVGVEVVLHRNGVQQEVEVPGSGFHLFGIGGHDHMVGALATTFFSLARRAGEQRHFRAHCLGKLDAHVAEAAHAENPDLIARFHAVMLERRVGSDAGAKDRRGAGQVEFFRDSHHEVFADHDAVGVTAHGVAAIDPVRGGISHGRTFEAVLLQVRLTGFAAAAGIDHAADANQIADFVPGDIRTNGGNFAYDLVARHQRVNGNAPLVAGLMDVGMTDAAVENVDGNVVSARAAAFEFYRGEGSGGRLGGVSDGGVHEEPRKSSDR
ncbi:hypothetical protein EMIT0P294_50214 [Pseudomonas sp. IT-P294]